MFQIMCKKWWTGGQHNVFKGEFLINLDEQNFVCVRQQLECMYPMSEKTNLKEKNYDFDFYDFPFHVPRTVTHS